MIKQPFFSVLMASTVSFKYRNAASHREAKLVRAINSVISQTFHDWELVIIADGCEKTIEIAKSYDDNRIKFKLIEKQALWSGIPRNVAKFHASGAWCVYLDNDDMFRNDHLQTIRDAIVNIDDPLLWCYFDDIGYSKGRGWSTNYVNIHELGRCGTSNIAHLKNLPVEWDINGNYAHDKAFIDKLKEYPQNAYIGNGGYMVCHVPPNLVNNGYDL